METVSVIMDVHIEDGRFVWPSGSRFMATRI